MGERDLIDDLLASVQRPSRYIGGEPNSVLKDHSQVNLKIALSFPDIYEVGMSHYGLLLLYDILNAQKEIACERVFLPWVDMADLLRKRGLALSSLESDTSLKEFDIVGISIPHELVLTNIVELLQLGGIHPLASERRENLPLVIGGGSGVFNPEPAADLFDALVIGDGEEAVLDISRAFMEWRKSGRKKEALLESLAKIDGVYVPSFFRADYSDSALTRIVPAFDWYRQVKRRILKNLDLSRIPSKPMVPNTELIHDRLTAEVMRGCTAGCRFCQAGITYRPAREKEPQALLEQITAALRESGYEEVSLLALSAGDYANLETLTEALLPLCAREKVAISLPSLRVGTLTDKIIERIRSLRKTGFTLAPEAGSAHLRSVINKRIDEEELLKCAQKIFACGWRNLKLYFMIGLPTETEDDVKEIVRLSAAVKSAGRAVGVNPNVNVSISSFVPKAHTPFQWEKQAPQEETEEKLSFLKKSLRRAGIQMKWHSPTLSTLEGVFSRGDRRLTQAVLEAHRLGARFDSWTEQFKEDAWKKAFENCGISPQEYLRERSESEVLPWSHINCGVTQEFLISERSKSRAREESPDCRIAGCANCGVCDLKAGEIPSEFLRQKKSVRLIDRKPRRYREIQFRCRITYTKLGRAAYLGHLELKQILERAFRRAELPLKYSEGFRPEPRISYSSPIPLGTESTAEVLDVRLTENLQAQEIIDRVNPLLPPGVALYSVKLIDPGAESISASVTGARYRVDLSHLQRRFTTDEISVLIGGFLSSSEIPFSKERKGKTRSVNMRDFVQSIQLREDGQLEITTRTIRELQVRVAQILRQLLQVDEEQLRGAKIRKVANILKSPDSADHLSCGPQESVTDLNPRNNR
jgi:radical SAM family uncharacterized protein/radical SAM-linked protein